MSSDLARRFVADSEVFLELAQGCKDWRRIVTRYDKLARNFLAAAALVGALYWIKL